MFPTNTYIDPVVVRFLPLRFVPPEPTSKAEEKILETEVSDEVRHAVNVWLYSQ